MRYVSTVLSVTNIDAARKFYESLFGLEVYQDCLLYTSPSPRDGLLSRMPSSA